MLRNSSPPIEPRRVEAPTTATVFGLKNGSSDAATATWSRSSTAARYSSVGAMLSRTSVVPPSSRREIAKPASAKTRSIGWFSGSTSATKVEIPSAAAEAASCSSRRVPTPVTLQRVGDRERDLGARRIAQPDVVRERHDLLALAVDRHRPDQSAAVVPIGVEERLDRLAA